QILTVTADNATNNDAMVAELEELLPEFCATNQIRCFLHVNNLVAKTLVRQFDLPKKSGNSVANDAEDD
ncbi:hypothetical protein CPC08DRAFT_610148, partial [Agrocybe pediades]